LTLGIDFVYSSTNGLETGMIIFLFTAAGTHLYLWKPLDWKRPAHIIASVSMASLLLLARVDGFVLAGSLYLGWTLVYWFLFKESFIRLVKGMIPVLGILFAVQGGYFLFRWIVFNDLMPNTYYVKVPSGTEKIFRTIILEFHGGTLYCAVATIWYCFPKVPFSLDNRACFIPAFHGGVTTC
jgi:hypothetical protein